MFSISRLLLFLLLVSSYSFYVTEVFIDLSSSHAFLDPSLRPSRLEHRSSREEENAFQELCDPPSLPGIYDPWSSTQSRFILCQRLLFFFFLSDLDWARKTILCEQDGVISGERQNPCVYNIIVLMLFHVISTRHIIPHEGLGVAVMYVWVTDLLFFHCFANIALVMLSYPGTRFFAFSCPLYSLLMSAASVNCSGVQMAIFANSVGHAAV